MGKPRVERRQCKQCGLKRPVTSYTATNGRVCKPCQRRTAARSTKDARLRATYGITIDEYDQILLRQGGCCAICNGKRSVYDVDHDHAKEKAGQPIRETVRGLLCRRCNRRLLPAAQDSQERLSAAIYFLDSPPAQEVLNGES